MGRLIRQTTVTDALPLDQARGQEQPRARFPRGTSREVTLDRALELKRRYTELRSLVIELVEQLVPARDQIRVFVFAPDVVFAWIDPLFIEHVVANLVTRALERSITSSSVVIRVEERRGAAVISITDNALVAPAQRDAALLSRADDNMTMNREIVMAHGGTLGAEQLATGSRRYVLELPLPTVESQRRPRLVGRRGLLVGRTLPHADSLLAMLAAEGMRTERLHTQQDAVRAIRRNRPDVVVAEAEMPGGFAWLRGALPEALLVVVTNNPATRLRAREFLVVVNPIDAGELFAIIAQRFRAE